MSKRNIAIGAAAIILLVAGAVYTQTTASDEVANVESTTTSTTAAETTTATEAVKATVSTVESENTVTNSNAQSEEESTTTTNSSVTNESEQVLKPQGGTGLQVPLFLYYVGNMKISIPDPYTTSLAVAMYYSVPVRRADDIAVVFEKEKKEKDPRKRIQPSKNIGSNIDTYA